MTLMLPLCFVLMPLSMRRAKVRWAHIVRVTIYSLFIPLLCVWVTAAVFSAHVALSMEGLMELYTWAARYVPWLAMALWWTAATGRYLRIPHAWLTIGLLTLIPFGGLIFYLIRHRNESLVLLFSGGSRPLVLLGAAAAGFLAL